MTAYPNLAREFPDYDLATLPPIPAYWEDNSWHNDTCPCFVAGDVTIFIDYADPAEREFADAQRFTLTIEGEGDAFATDDWQQMLDLVAARTNGA